MDLQAVVAEAGGLDGESGMPSRSQISCANSRCAEPEKTVMSLAGTTLVDAATAVPAGPNTVRRHRFL